MDSAKKTLRWLPAVMILASVVALGAWTPAEATMDIAVKPHVLRAATSRVAQASDPDLVEALSADNDALVRYIDESMLAWTKMPSAQEDDAALAQAQDRAAKAQGQTWATVAVKRAQDAAEYHAAARARYGSIASDIVHMVRSEKPAFPSDEDRSRTAVLVATVAFYEGAFAAYVDKGQCNDWKWRHPKTSGPDAMAADEVAARKALLASGGCDGGWAYSLWQIHPFDSSWREGIVLLDDSRQWSFASYVHDGVERKVIMGSDLIADRQLASQVALRMLRRSLGPTGSGNLCGYTGEGSSCWKAALRQNFALDWSRRHPFGG
jgi:hypothetical protein